MGVGEKERHRRILGFRAAVGTVTGKSLEAQVWEGSFVQC